MHIVQIVTTHPPFDVRVFYKISRTIIDSGHRVTMLMLYNGSADFNPGIEYEILPRPNNRFLRVYVGRRLGKRALEFDADLYIIHDTEVLNIAGYLSRHGKKVIHDAMETYPDYISEKPWVPNFLRSRVKKIVANSEMRGAKNCDGLIVAMRANEERLKPAGKPILTLHNFPFMSDILDEVPLKENIILYAGGLTRFRKIREILKLSNHLNSGGLLDGWKLKIIGPVFDDAYWLDCKEDLQIYNGNSQCEILDKLIPYTDVLSAVKKAKIGLSFLIPTEKYDKCISTKVFDYMAKGTIPIATWLSSYEGLVSDADGPIFIPAGDEDKVPQIIADLARDEDAMRQRAETCLKSVREKFNWEADAQHLPEFIERIAGKE